MLKQISDTFSTSSAVNSVFKQMSYPVPLGVAVGVMGIRSPGNARLKSKTLRSPRGTAQLFSTLLVVALLILHSLI
ncbi:hypothetical protein [Paenibacillus graminis]|uniref:hypothetical protein n=1 Tax=Paenibacillus graminis TaxID=189425 RepID=UPI002DBCA70C|nr:hypothetical protein [Paenibacillus graminis]MEC0167677.1 hypothetical protein [Paenibacillus graminis]